MNARLRRGGADYLLRHAPKVGTGPEKYNSPETQRRRMSLSLEDDCPKCDASEFYKAASMRIHLGIKKKWHCTDCEYGFVTINGIDTRA